MHTYAEIAVAPPTMQGDGPANDSLRCPACHRPCMWRRNDGPCFSLFVPRRRPTKQPAKQRCMGPLGRARHVEKPRVQAWKVRPAIRQGARLRDRTPKPTTSPAMNVIHTQSPIDREGASRVVKQCAPEPVLAACSAPHGAAAPLFSSSRSTGQRPLHVPRQISAVHGRAESTPVQPGWSEGADPAEECTHLDSRSPRVRLKQRAPCR